MKSSEELWGDYWEIKIKACLARATEDDSLNAKESRAYCFYSMTKLLEDARHRHRQLQRNLDDVANLCDRLEVALEHDTQ